MRTTRVMVVGYGHVGKEAALCVRQADDMELAGIVDIRHRINGDVGCPVVTGIHEIEALGQVDVAILATPSRAVPSVAPSYLQKGINTVDCYDIHGDSLISLRRDLHQQAEKGGSVAITTAGWDPGTNSIVRILFQAMAPRGLTYTNYGPGMSMGHTVAAKAIPGVRAALSLTIPKGSGQHRRDVYVELEDGVEFSQVERAILEDPYFQKDETRIVQVPSVTELETTGHGVLLQRYGGSGSAENQELELRLRVTNPSLTGQIMAAAARASTHLTPGAYTLAEIPPILLLAGDREDLLKRLT
jgi:diaminopimelate dehydrogenase